MVGKVFSSRQTDAKFSGFSEAEGNVVCTSSTSTQPSARAAIATGIRRKKAVHLVYRVAHVKQQYMARVAYHVSHAV